MRRTLRIAFGQIRRDREEGRGGVPSVSDWKALLINALYPRSFDAPSGGGRFSASPLMRATGLGGALSSSANVLHLLQFRILLHDVRKTHLVLANDIDLLIGGIDADADSDGGRHTDANTAKMVSQPVRSVCAEA